ncbi:hypothetical protein A2246_04265 [candidate division WOR-1 bacterium RIFOXYA2_FULL_37_7]|nr:MAG: hypothetical protein A2246_04265 [candidate division WOR-1 bacterium RIFOXYA2_FULL_37_7]
MGYGKTKTSSVVQDLGKIGLEPLRRGEDEDYAGVEQRIYETPYGVRKTDPHLLHLFARQNGVYKQNDIDSYPSSDALRNARDNIINLMPISLQYGEVLLDNINSFLALSKSFVENFDKEGLSTLTLEVFLKKIDYTLTFSIEAPHEADRISVLTPRWHLAIQKGQSKEGVPVSLTGNIDD